MKGLLLSALPLLPNTVLTVEPGEQLDDTALKKRPQANGAKP